MSCLILWLPNIVLYPNKWILVKNCIFSDTIPGRFSNLSVPLKINKNARKRTKNPKIPFWWAHIIKIVGNYVWNEFWDISGRKVLIKFFFSFLPQKAWFFKNKFQKAWNTLFWPRKPGLMCFPWSFNDKLVVGTQKEGGSKKGTTNP